MTYEVLLSTLLVLTGVTFFNACAKRIDQGGTVHNSNPVVTSGVVSTKSIEERGGSDEALCVDIEENGSDLLSVGLHLLAKTKYFEAFTKKGESTQNFALGPMSNSQTDTAAIWLANLNCSFDGSYSEKESSFILGTNDFFQDFLAPPYLSPDVESLRAVSVKKFEQLSMNVDSGMYYPITLLDLKNRIQTNKGFFFLLALDGNLNNYYQLVNGTWEFNSVVGHSIVPNYNVIARKMDSEWEAMLLIQSFTSISQEEFETIVQNWPSGASVFSFGYDGEHSRLLELGKREFHDVGYPQEGSFERIILP